MLIPFVKVLEIAAKHGKYITGILHIGAHTCEEKEEYNKYGISDRNLYWIEGSSEKVALNKSKGIANVYEALIFNEEKEVDFHVSHDSLTTWSSGSSSILPFGTHSSWYPHITIVDVQKKKTMRLKHWIEENNIPIKRLNFWNLDIQGVELEALKSADEYIEAADVLYVEVNVQPVYQGCALLPEVDYFLQEKGFQRVAIEMAAQGWGDAVYVKLP